MPTQSVKWVVALGAARLVLALGTWPQVRLPLPSSVARATLGG